jgi:hypothetical protein
VCQDARPDWRVALPTFQFSLRLNKQKRADANYPQTRARNHYFYFIIDTFAIQFIAAIKGGWITDNRDSINGGLIL